MSGHPAKPVRFPRLPLYGAFALIGCTFAAIVFGQATGIGVVKLNLGAPEAIRDVVLMRDGNDRIRVTDAAGGELIAEYETDQGGFVRGALRGLDRIRHVERIGLETPYRIIRWQNGALSLSDTGTGQRIYINAFGPDNVAAVDALLRTNQKQGG